MNVSIASRCALLSLLSGTVERVLLALFMACVTASAFAAATVEISEFARSQLSLLVQEKESRTATANGN